jgi:thiol-disulfide isomerase/thioredoxin
VTGTSSTPPLRILLSVILLVAAACAAGFLMYRLTAPKGTTYLMAASQARAGTPVAVDSRESGQDPANNRKIPDVVPQISLPGLDGRPHALSDYRGKLLVVNFWATWCEPCRREIPLLKSLRTEYAANGLEIVGIAVDSRDDVAKYVGTHGIAYPVLLGERGGLEAASAFGMDVVLPFSVFADRAGHIVALKIGELRPEEAHMILSGVRELDEGRLTLAAAQARISAAMAELSARRAGVAGSTQE